MAKSTDNGYTGISVSYIDSDGTARWETLDENELNWLEVDMNTIFEQYRKAGVRSLTMNITFGDTNE